MDIKSQIIDVFQNDIIPKLMSHEQERKFLKSEVYKQTLDSLTDIFSRVEPDVAKLYSGVIKHTAFIYSEMWELQRIISDVGVVRVHPSHSELQKDTLAGKQYPKWVTSYNDCIKTLRGALKNVPEGEDAFDKFLADMNASG